MPQRGKNSGNSQQPAFSVQDEIRRDRRMRRANRMRRARSRARTAITVLLCTVICILLVSAIVAMITRVQVVSVVGNARYTSEEILTAANLEGEIMPLLGEKTVRNRITATCPYVDEVELIKEYPSTLTVKVIETEAVYALRTRERTLTLDADLRVMDYTDDIEGLILLTLPELKSAVEGSRIVFVSDESDEYVSEMLEVFFEGGCAPWLTELDITDRFNLTGKAGNSAEIIFGDYKNIPEKIIITGQLISDAKEEYAKYAYIDVSVPSQASLKLEY